MKFTVNNDLDRVVFNKHNLFHFWFSFLLAVIFDFQTAYSVGVAWEFGDGWKPNWKDFSPKGVIIRDWFVSNFLYADGYSLQDLLVHDLCGAAIGHVVGRIIRLIFGV